MDKVDLATRIALEHGLENIAKRSKWGQLLDADGILATQEFFRISRLPRRNWETDESLHAATAAVNEWLRKPGGTMQLWPVQAAALIELATTKGALGQIAVGKGKSLITLLAPVVLAAKRPILLVPAQLRVQTLEHVIPEMRRHWRLHEGLRVLGYSELSIAKNKDLLFELLPDLIVLDECQAVRNGTAARTKRLRAYLKEFPETQVVAVSGSIVKRSVLDYWQLALWALKPDLCPLPNTWREVSDWAAAIDADVPAEKRRAPGALLRFCNDGEEARVGYGRRLTETPGIVATSTNDLGVSLILARRKVRVPEKVLAAMATMRTTWITPYGDEITEAIDLWRHMRELACGFYYRWDPAPPAAWLTARREWKQLVRATLAFNRKGLDSELLVARWYAEQAKKGQGVKETKENVAIWEAWQVIKDSFEPNSVPYWLDDFAVRDAHAWLKQYEGIVWTEHVAFAKELAEYSGAPYFGAGMEASRDILTARGPIIASVAAHGEGKNLQQWSHNLITAPSSSGKTWEQVIGRTHRMGQLADEDYFDIWLHAAELEASFERARSDAAYIEQTTGARQKLCYADIVLAPGGGSDVVG